MAIGVLGPLAAEVDGVPAELSGPRQRAVLALLLTARGETLSADRMIDDLWNGAPPPRARASLQAYVSHLRRGLEPGRSRRAPARLLVSTRPGYALHLPEEAVDAWRFERALTRTRHLLAPDPGRARTETAAALRLWRGAAYAEFADAPWAAAETARLTGLRLTAREIHAAATLRLGRPGGPVPGPGTDPATAPAAEDAVLDGLDAGVAAGLLTEPGPGRVRFAHTLVRDTLYTDTSGLRRARLHAALGRALRELRPDDVSAIAHHHLRAPGTATARTAVDYAVRAAALAGRRYAHDTAAGLLGRAVACVDRHPAAFAGEDAAARVVALLGLQLQARARGGAVVEAQAVRARAMDVAERHGRDDLLVEALTAWTEPTAWERRPYPQEDTRAAAVLRRLLADRTLDDAVRCRLLDALAAAVDSSAGPVHAGRAAAAEAVDLARGLGDPGLLAQVLATRSRAMDWEIDPAPREKIAAELAQLAAEHDMPTYAWFAAYLAAGTAAVRGDVAAIRRHVARGLEIAETHRLSEPDAVRHVQLAALHMAGDRLAAAERGYTEAVARLRANGSPHAQDRWTVSRFALCWRKGRPAEVLPELREALSVYGALAGDSLALALIDAGRPDEARAVRAERPPIRQDFFYSLFLTARALAVVALEERDEAEGLLAELLPLRDVVAGAASGCLALRPVAQTLGDLALLLGRTDQAADHYAHAATVARRWQAPRWLADAEAALAALPYRSRAGCRS